MNLLIWHPDLSRVNEWTKDFDGIFIPCGDFYNKSDESLDYEQKQLQTADMMYQFYIDCKQLGFKMFIVDGGWGLGTADNNYFYERVMNKFKDCKDVLFYHDEIIEAKFESGEYSKEDCLQILSEKYKYANGRFFTGSTSRNQDYLRRYHLKIGSEAFNKIAHSGYYNNKKYWRSGDIAQWIYGQLKIGGSLRYKHLLELAKGSGIKNLILYQCDNGFDIKLPYTWFNSLLRLLGIKEWFEKWNRKRLVKLKEKIFHK